MHKSQKRTIYTWIKLFVAVLLFSFGNYALNTLWPPFLVWVDGVLGSGSEEAAWPPQFVLLIVVAILSYGLLITIITSWFSDFARTSGVGTGSEDTITTEARSAEQTGGGLSAGQETKPVPIERTDPLPFPAVWGAGGLLFLLGWLLFSADSDICFSIAVISWGLSAILVGYAAWSVCHSKDDSNKPLEFARQASTAFCIVLAVLGVALVLQGIGSLVGWEGLRFIGSTLAEVFGGS